MVNPWMTQRCGYCMYMRYMRLNERDSRDRGNLLSNFSIREDRSPYYG